MHLVRHLVHLVRHQVLSGNNRVHFVLVLRLLALLQVLVQARLEDLGHKPAMPFQLVDTLLVVYPSNLTQLSRRRYNYTTPLSLNGATTLSRTSQEIKKPTP